MSDCRARDVIPESSEWQTEQKHKSEGVFGGPMYWMGSLFKIGICLGEELKDKKEYLGSTLLKGAIQGGKY